MLEYDKKKDIYKQLMRQIKENGLEQVVEIISKNDKLTGEFNSLVYDDDLLCDMYLITLVTIIKAYGSELGSIGFLIQSSHESSKWGGRLLKQDHLVTQDENTMFIVKRTKSDKEKFVFVNKILYYKSIYQ